MDEQNAKFNLRFPSSAEISSSLISISVQLPIWPAACGLCLPILRRLSLAASFHQFCRRQATHISAPFRNTQDFRHLTIRLSEKCSRAVQNKKDQKAHCNRALGPLEKPYMGSVGLEQIMWLKFYDIICLIIYIL